jgi:initiation factor 1A
MPQKKISKQNAMKAQKNRTVSRSLIEDGDAQFALIEKALGNLRFQIRVSKDKTAVAKLRGALRGKAVRVEINDIVQISRRDFENEKAEHYDILCRIEPKDSRQLRKDGRLNSLVGDDTWEFEVGEETTVEIDDGYTKKETVEEDIDIENI